MGLCKRLDVGDLEPDMSGAGNQRFSAEITVEDGILQSLEFVTDGDHDTLITDDGQDGEVDIIASLTVRIPRKNMPEAQWNWRPRDLKHLNHFLSGTLPTRGIVLADLGAHFGKFTVPLVLPDHLTLSPEEWGLDTREIDGPILVNGRYGVPADLGVGATAVRNNTNIVACVRERNEELAPSVFLVGNSQRVAHESAGSLGPATISTGVIEHLYALYLRVMDESAEPDGRTNSMITKFETRHTFEGDLDQQTWQQLVKQSQQAFGIPAAELPDGVAIQLFAEGGQLEDMPVMSGQTLRIRHNSEEAISNEFSPRITIATGDHFFANALGVQLTEAGAIRAAQAQEQLLDGVA